MEVGGETIYSWRKYDNPDSSRSYSYPFAMLYLAAQGIEKVFKLMGFWNSLRDVGK